MSLPSRAAARRWPGQTVVDREGDAVGRITHVYLDRDSGQPKWVLVAMPGRGRVFIPLAGAGTHGRRVRVEVTKAAAKEAPEVRSGRKLADQDEARLHGHYGLAPTGPDRGAKRVSPAGGRVKDAASRLNQLAGAASNRLQGAGGRVRGVATSPRAKRLNAAAAAAAVGAAAASLRAAPRPLPRKRRSKMAGKFKLGIGLAVGYVLGSRAGRERYEQLADAARRLAGRPEVQQLAGKVRSSRGTGMDEATGDLDGGREETATSTGTGEGSPASLPPAPKADSSPSSEPGVERFPSPESGTGRHERSRTGRR